MESVDLALLGNWTMYLQTFSVVKEELDTVTVETVPVEVVVRVDGPQNDSEGHAWYDKPVSEVVLLQKLDIEEEVQFLASVVASQQIEAPYPSK